MLVRKDYWGSKRTAALIHPSYSWKADLFCTMQVQRKKYIFARFNSCVPQSGF